MNALSGVLFSFVLLWSATAFAGAWDDPTPATPQIILVSSSEGILPVGELIHMEPGHLAALGIGVVAGAAVIGPYLGIGELIGVGIGVIGSELVYRSTLWPFHKSWFE